MVNPFRIYVGAYSKIAGMDDAGEIILGTYLNGDGSPVSVRDDPFWNAYMMRHKSLRGKFMSSWLLPSTKWSLTLNAARTRAIAFPSPQDFMQSFRKIATKPDMR